MMAKFSEICTKRYKTAVLYFSFLSLGLSTAIPGPTLLDLQVLVKTDISHIAYIYLARSSGYLFGSFIGGILLDWLKKKQMFLLIFNLIISIGLFVTPWCRDVSTLISVMAISGAAMGALDTGGNCWCLDLWSENSSLYFQALHFLFGLGAFLSPLIAEPFLSQQEDYDHTLNNTSDLEYHLSHATFTPEQTFLESLPRITFAYGILGLFALFVTFMFVVLFCISTTEESQKHEKSTVNCKESNTIVLFFVIFLSSLLLSIYAGIEIGYGQMVATFAVKSHYHFSKATASLMTSVYWGTFTFSRGVSIILAAKLSPLSLIITDFVLMLFGSAILLFLASLYVEFFWIGTAVLGFALASFYPTTITWVEKHINVSNKVASAFVVAASLGEMIVPLTVSQFVATNPKILLYLVFYSVLACGVLIVILWIVLKRIGNKYVITQTVRKNTLENVPCELNTQIDSLENELSRLNSQNDFEDDSI